MTTEELRVVISAKISDFDKKMTSVDKKIATVEKSGTAANKAINRMLSAKSAGTNKAVDLVNAKLKQVKQTAASTKKVLSEKIPISIDNSGLDIHAMKLDLLKQKYTALITGTQTPGSLRTMEREFKVLGTQIDTAKAKQAALNAEIEQLAWNEKASAGTGNAAGAAAYHAQMLSARSQLSGLAAITSELETRAGSLGSKIQAIRLDPTASSEAQILAARIREADAKMSSLGNNAVETTGKIRGMKSGSSALDTINRKISNLERSSARTANAVGKLGRRFLVLFTGKLISMAFKGIQDSLTGAATKSEQLENSLNTLSSAGRTISNAVVAALTPLITVAAPMIDFISKKVIAFGNSVAMFFAAISGQSTVLQAVAAYEAYGGAAEGAGASAAAGAAEARKALAGFDQITKLDTSSSSGSSGSGASSGGGGASSYETVPVVQSANSEKMLGIIDKLKGPLSSFYKDVLEPLGKWVMGDGIDLLVTGLDSVAGFFHDNPGLVDNLAFFLLSYSGLAALGPKALVIGLLIQVTVAAAEVAGTWIGNWLMANKRSETFSLMTTIMPSLSEDTKWYEMLLAMLGTAVTWFGYSLIVGLGKVFTWFAKQIDKVWVAMGFEPVEIDFEFDDEAQLWLDEFNSKLEDTKDLFDDLAKSTLVAYNRRIRETNTVTETLTGKNTLFGKSFVDLTGKTDKQKQSFNFLGEAGTGAGDDISTAVNTAILPTMSAADTGTATATSGMKTSFSTLSPTIQGYLNDLSISVDGKTIEIRDLLAGNIGAGTTSVSNAFGGMSNSATIRMLQMAQNSRLALLNILDNMGLLPTRTDAASVTASRQKILGGRLTELPMFATGGVVNKATNAIIGESGKEVVMPLERNTGWIDQLADRVAAKNGGDIYLTNITTIDGRVVSREVTKIQKRDSRRSNKPVWGNA